MSLNIVDTLWFLILNILKCGEKRENSESIFDLDLSSTMYSGSRELIGAVVAPSSYGAMVATTDFLNLLNEDPSDVRLGLLINDKEGKNGL